MLALLLAKFGFNVVSTVRALLAAGTLSLIALGSGYVYGRMDGAAICTANEAWLKNLVVEQDGAARDEADAANKEAITNTETTESHNNDLDKELATPSSDDARVVLNARWMQSLGKLR